MTALAESSKVAFDPSRSFCRHCGDLVPLARRKSFGTDSAFCCAGCLSVHEFLRERNLDGGYYRLRDSSGPLGGARVKPSQDSNEDFSALDEPPYRSLVNAPAALDFYLEGIHCTACVWILERLPSMDPAVRFARVEIGRSILRVGVTAEGKFEDVARLLLRLGYRPHPVVSEADVEQKLREEDRRTLKRMGVAAFAAMNVMIYSFSLYSGVEGREAWLFRGFSLLAGLPALTYSAWPFYRSAYAALRNRRISIDLPISLAFIGGFGESVRQVVLGTNLVYLDSLTSLVFLMLASRYTLSRLERAELSKSGLDQSLLPARVMRFVKGSEHSRVYESVRLRGLERGDLVRVTSGNAIPVDGVVERGEAAIDTSVFNGESKWSRVGIASKVFAGTRVVDGEIAVRVTARGRDTRLGKIEDRLDTILPKRNRRTERSDRWASIFLSVVLGLAGVLLFAFGRENMSEAIRRSLSLLIVACPCALALATPLTLARAFRLAAVHGILIRDLDVLERLRTIRRVVFDKTGTLTQGAARLQSWDWSNAVPLEKRAFLQSVAYSMELSARHPYGQAIVRELENHRDVRHLPEIEVVAEVGRGVRSNFNGIAYSIQAPRPAGSQDSSVEFSGNGEVIARLGIRDELRAEAPTVVTHLKARRLELEILSGDAEDPVREVAVELGILAWRARATPEQKHAQIKRHSEIYPTMVVGDGLNDALALKEAAVSVALNRGSGSSIESTLRTSDVAIVNGDLGAVVDLFEIADRYDSTLRRNMILSVLYNLAGGSLAVSGHIHPLVAAVAMPLSALSVYLSTAFGLRKLSVRRPK